MSASHKAITILMADDDPDDRLLTKKALAAARLNNDFRVVNDGVELMDYLQHRGTYQDPKAAPRPGLILLDLNMPRRDGRQCLELIKGDASLRSIPVVVLTTSKAEEDICRSYDLGANSYVKKPVTFEGLVEIVRTLRHYWLELVEPYGGHDDR